MRRESLLLNAALGLFLLSGVASGQPTAQVAFAPGGQELFALDLSRAPIGGLRSTIELPRGTVKPLAGSMAVVTRNGRPMLRATEHSELLITLPSDQQLPQNFTIEVDLVPKACCPPPDLTLEGTSELNQDVGSAHLLFTTDASFGWIGVVGGAQDNHQFEIQNSVRTTLPEALTRVGVSVEGSTIRFFINGVEILPYPEEPARKVQARFARGNVLRVTLGGLTEDEGRTVRPVYLSRVRIATGAPVTVAAVIPVDIPAASTGTILGVGPTAVTGIVARVGPQGDASVSWSALAGATSYFVVRWKVDDAACCNNSSPPAGMNRLEWADGVLPMAGTYAYRVYATTSSGILVGETSVTYQPAAPAPAPNPVQRTGSAIPAPRTIDVGQVVGSGGGGAPRPVAPRTMSFPLIEAQGAGSGGVIVAPRTIAIAGVTGVGPIRTNVRIVSTDPAPRTIAVSAVTAVGGGALSVLPPVPRAIALPALAASGGTNLSLVAPRTINLPALTATGPVRTR